jgi:uncharacterized protein (TIGR02996 family)
MAKKKQVATHDQAFLDDIIANPADDTPRLVYADWLDDHGQGARAEFIRLQCQLAALGEHDPERFALEQREEELLAVHGEEWLPALPAWARRGGHFLFRRGFLDRASVTVTEFLKHSAVLFAAAPVRDLHFSNPNLRDKAAELAASPLLGRLAALEFEGQLTADDLRTLGASPHLGHLESLAIPWTELTEPHARALAGWPGLPRLRRLRLCFRGTQALEFLALPGRLSGLEWLLVGENETSVGFGRLADNAPALTSLVIPSTALTPEKVAALARPGRLPALTSLHVSGDEHTADTLASSPLLKRLTSLELDWTPLRLASLKKLTSGTRLARLRRLVLVGTTLGTEGASLFAAAPLDALAHLTLHESELDGEAFDCLADSPRLGGLRSLNLQGNPIGDAGAAALARSPHLTGLTFLDLGYCEIGPAGAAALAASPNLARLRHLRLTRNKLGDDGVRALAGSRHLGELRALELVGVGMSEEGLRALAHAPGLGNLRQLYVYYNNEFKQGSAAVREFRNPARLPNLLCLAIENWHTDPQVLTKLGRKVVV